MKFNKIIFPALACTLMLGSCDDNKMEWGTPDGHGEISESEMPLALKEKIANYDYIKAYAAQYTPNLIVGLGLGTDEYIGNADYKAIADANFQMFTTGNAMKHQTVVQSDGTLKLTTVDAFLEAVPTDIQIYGHNFIWHTQQNQNYLKSLIAPQMNIESDSNVANILTGDASDFNNGTSGGWSSWGDNKEEQTIENGIGEDGTACMALKNKGDNAGAAYTAQCGYTFDTYLQANKEYIIKFKAKSSSNAGKLQFQYQNGTNYGSQGGYNTFDIGSMWNTYEYEFITTYEDVNRIILNFGEVGGTYYIDDIEFGLKIDDTMTNILAGDNSDFEGGTKGSWGSWGNSSSTNVSAKEEGYKSDYCVVLVNPSDGDDYYAAQFAYTFNEPLAVGETYIIQFYAKSTINSSGVQFASQNSNDYSGEGYHAFTLSTDWTLCEYEYTCTKENIDRILINFGKNAATFHVDNIKFGLKKEPQTKAVTRSTTITYIPKTAQEKKTVLLNAMESWIKGMAEHVGDRIKDWDVINEPITDNCQWRGIDGAFGGTDSEGKADMAPTEDAVNGLNLNWSNETGNGHFYWGYYLGKEYATKAFEYARQYCAQGSRLFVNEYNLETNPNKLAALIEFVKYIDQNNSTGAAIVDGIGTQMHVTASGITKEQIDAMFKTLAATGKLIRVTELDVALGTATPSAEQLAAQSDVYQMIFESYKENIPEAQQSGITIWTLSDNPDEHQYWLKDQSPNLFDANYARKHAYKGVCDGIAGKDISEGFTGTDWEKVYE